jgi:acetyl-CoA acetyltransferase
MENGICPGSTATNICARTVKDALDDAGLQKKDIQGFATAGSWGFPGVGQMMSLTVSEYLGIHPIMLDGTSVGGSSFELHLAHMSMAIEKGYFDVGVITYGSTQRSGAERTLGGRRPAFNAQYETPFGLPTPVGAYAMAAHRHMHQYGTTSEQLAEIAVATRKWAAMNPNAWNKEPMSIQEVVESPMIADPLHLKDCCLVTDGGGAVVVTTEERARDLKKKPVFVRGYGEATDHALITAMPDLTVTVAAVSGKAAMKMAGVTHKDINHVMIYDSFTITVLLTLESLGFCGKGEGGAFVSKQRTAPGGAFPMNTNGGGLSYCHPGMYGIFLLIESTRQLRGECGPRQVPNCKISLCNGTGGVLSSTGTVILSRD